jgi:hypothetical protein
MDRKSPFRLKLQSRAGIRPERVLRSHIPLQRPERPVPAMPCGHNLSHAPLQRARNKSRSQAVRGVLGCIQAERFCASLYNHRQRVCVNGFFVVDFRRPHSAKDRPRRDAAVGQPGLQSLDRARVRVLAVRDSDVTADPRLVLLLFPDMDHKAFGPEVHVVYRYRRDVRSPQSRCKAEQQDGLVPRSGRLRTVKAPQHHPELLDRDGCFAPHLFSPNPLRSRQDREDFFPRGLNTPRQAVVVNDGADMVPQGADALVVKQRIRDVKPHGVGGGGKGFPPFLGTPQAKGFPIARVGFERPWRTNRFLEVKAFPKQIILVVCESFAKQVELLVKFHTSTAPNLRCAHGEATADYLLALNKTHFWRRMWRMQSCQL